MKIVTTVFDYQDNPFDYDQLYNVFVASCRRHMPEIEVVTLRLNVLKAKDDRKPGLWTNTCKLRAQVEFLDQVDDDIVFSDCDMLCVRSIDDVWGQVFDIAYTVKPEWKKTRCRLNGGVLFVRNNDKAHEWMRKLLEINDKMYHNYEFHKKWRARYFGMNQSAMGYMIESRPVIANAVPVPTQIWNAVDCDWNSVDDNTRFIHIKGKLRRGIFQRQGYREWAEIMKEWYSYTEKHEFDVVEKMPWDIKPPKKKRAIVRGFTGRVLQ